jgi:DNA anti-recombination protein RmuC
MERAEDAGGRGVMASGVDVKQTEIERRLAALEKRIPELREWMRSEVMESARQYQSREDELQRRLKAIARLALETGGL